MERSSLRVEVQRSRLKPQRTSALVRPHHLAELERVTLWLSIVDKPTLARARRALCEETHLDALNGFQDSVMTQYELSLDTLGQVSP